jgi:Icc protein
MELMSRKRFLKHFGVSGASLLLPSLSLTATSTQATPKSASRSLTVAHLTDIHVQAGKESEQGFAYSLQTANAYPEKIDFIINGGDSIMNPATNMSRSTVKSQWTLFHSILKQNNTLPVFHCLGNHDLFEWASPNRFHASAKQWALEEYRIPLSYYAFEQGNWKFIVLDSIHGRNTVPGYYAKLDEEQRNWLEQELKRTPENQFICIVTHIPILAVCTLFDSTSTNSEHWSIPNNTLHADARDLTALFYKYPKIKACLSGHIHMVDHVNYLGIDYFCNGAVSGSWWKGNYHEFPPSFSLMTFYDNGRVERKIVYYDRECTS